MYDQQKQKNLGVSARTKQDPDKSKKANNGGLPPDEKQIKLKDPWSTDQKVKWLIKLKSQTGQEPQGKTAFKMIWYIAAFDALFRHVMNLLKFFISGPSQSSGWGLEYPHCRPQFWRSKKNSN